MGYSKDEMELYLLVVDLGPTLVEILGLRARGTPVPDLVVPDARQREELRALGYVE